MFREGVALLFVIKLCSCSCFIPSTCESVRAIAHDIVPTDSLSRCEDMCILNDQCEAIVFASGGCLQLGGELGKAPVCSPVAPACYIKQSGCTSSSSTTTLTATSSTSESPTTTTPQQCSYKFPPASGATATSGSSHCPNDPFIGKLFTDPNILAIRGFPCTSTKPCNTCIMFITPPWPNALPCFYLTYPTSCSDKNNKRYINILCKIFFASYDFVPLGTNVPSFDWAKGSMPSRGDESTCSEVSTSTDLSKLKDNNIPMDQDFLKTLNSSTTPCQLAELAFKAAEDHYNSPASSGKRKKRSGAIDLPENEMDDRERGGADSARSE